MKIAFDFDGVCTDLSFVREQKVNEFDYLYSPFSISTSKTRKGILEIVSVFGLFADLFIITSRPVEDKIYIKDWLARNQMQHFFQEIICCSDVSKSEIMKQNGITLLIDDKIKHLVSLTENLKGILWDKQTWIELLDEIFNLLISSSNISLKSKTELILKRVEYTTDLGSSPVFILNFNNKTKLKLRVCLNEEIKNRIVNFLKIAERNNYNNVSRLIASNGLAILKSYIVGNLISILSKKERLIYISKAGSALAKLHSIKVDNSISNLKFHMNDKTQSLLVFSADNYNMIITPENEVSFIDLEACNSGSRWIDLIWADNLLCETEQEKEALIKGYYKIYKGKEPTEEENKLSKLNYKLWLTYQLQQSKSIHLNDLKKMKIIVDTISELWNKK